MIVKKQKTIILFLLFACTLFLTGKFVVGLSSVQTNSKNLGQVLEFEYDLQTVFKPESYIISFGGGVYTKNAYEYNDVIWKDVQKRLMSIVSDLNFEKNLSYLSFEQWCDQLQNRGVYFRLPFSMSFDELCILLGIDKNNSDLDINIDGIWISKDDSQSIYLSDEIQKIYCRLQVEESFDKSYEIANVIDIIENDKIIEYRRISDLFSFNLSESDNVSENKENFITNELFPVTNKNIGFIKITTEFSMDEKHESLFKSFAQKAFGKNFNFVKKMTDVDESIIYVYGYANKALRIGSDGSIEYTQRFDKKQGVEFNFRDGLKHALYYIQMYGGIPDTLYLSNYYNKSDDMSRQILIFDFDYRIAHLPIIYSGKSYNHAIHIEITEGQISKFYRQIYVLDDNAESYVLDNARTFNETLNENGSLIQKNYLEVKDNLLGISESDLWLYILRDIVNVDIGYTINSKEKFLYPIWKCKVNNHKYNFLLYK